MTIQELGSIGEFISSFAVLITVIYLAVQIRQARNATVASTMQTNRAQFQNIMIANRDSLIAPIIIKSDAGESLTAEEEYRLSNHINLQWNLLFTEFVQLQIGYTQGWAPSDELALKKIFVRYGGRAADWWEATGKKIYPTAFIDHVEEKRP
jgi:hypothetical protein